MSAAIELANIEKRIAGLNATNGLLNDRVEMLSHHLRNFVEFLTGLEPDDKTMFMSLAPFQDLMSDGETLGIIGVQSMPNPGPVQSEPLSVDEGSGD